MWKKQRGLTLNTVKGRLKLKDLLAAFQQRLNMLHRPDYSR